MNLEIIRTQTTWNDAAGSINNNYAKIADAIAQLKANGGGGGGGADIDLTAYATKVWVEAKGYITASALTPYALKTDIPSLVGYATEDFVNNQLGDYATKDFVTTKLLDYAPLTSVQGFENRIAGLEGAVPQLNEKVSTVEGEVSTLNEIVSTGENNLLDRVNTIETDYVTSGNLESAINDIDLSIYLKTEDAEDTYATKDFVTTKLLDYAPLTSVQGFENRIAGLEGAVPQLNEKVSTVEGEVSTLNEIVSTGENNLLDRVNTIETDYVTSGNLESAINDIDLSIYLKTEDAEDTYATKDYVNNKLTNYATTDSVTAIQNTLTGQIGAVGARVDSNDEQIAILNETTSGHTTSIGTLTQRVDSVEQLATTKLDSSYFTLTNIKSTLGISDWALAATKPSYAWSEITSRPTALSQFTDDVVAGNYIRATVYSSYWDADSLYDAGVYSGYILHLPSGLPYGVIYTLPYRKGLGNTMPDFGAQLFIPCGDDSTSPNDMFFRTSLADAWNAWNKVITDKNIGDYNAGSATKLQTHCSIWGQSFDGTGDVSGTFRQLYKGSYDGAVAHSILCNINRPYGLITRINGNGDVLQQAQRETTEVEWFNFILQPLGGNVGIGNTSPTERLDVSGNIKASGNINATSITINGVTITASNGSITVNGNVLATGSITAKKSV